MSPAAPRFSPAFHGQLWSLLILVALLAVLPAFGMKAQVMQLLILAFILSIPATGLSLLYGDGGQMSVANGALYGVGAYTAAMLAIGGYLSFWASLPVAALAAAAAATVVGMTALRVRGHYFLIITFAFAELWRISLVNLRGITGGNQGILVLQEINLIGFGRLGSLLSFYYLALAFVVAAGLIVLVLRFSSFGRGLRAMRENERLAISLGLNARLARVAAFAVSGALAGFAGVLYAYQVKHIGPELFGAHQGINIVLVLLIGGARSLIGPVIGAMVFLLLPIAISLDPVWTQILYGAILISIVLVSPQGLVPTAADLLSKLWQSRAHFAARWGGAR